MRKILIVFTFITAIYACSKSDESTPEVAEDSFDRSAMLVHWADNSIVPSYNQFTADVALLSTRSGSFIQTPDQATLTAVRNAYKDAYIAFQNISMFEIGPAETVRFRDRMNTYPTNVSEIESFSISGNTDFTLPSTNDAQGFPAIDYMIYGVGSTDAEILDFYTTHPNAEKNRDYLTALTNSILDLATNVRDSWTGGFRDDFVNNNGSSASASVDKLTNDFIFYYEKSLRAGKIGIPAGVFSNAPLPNTVEAFYTKDFSKTLAVAGLNATERFFRGQSFSGNQTGPSYASYLNFLNTIKNGEDLSGLILAQFATTKSKLNGLDSDFTNQIQMDNGKMLETYDELQRNVILLKVDMLQALSIDVDFVDADGD
ncbi:imelysin family protein [Rasiella sp. SM2506]|uniref:imelysin family protein n=1 Tax=Rasiella sp. SM2506 TaxID=3423914 RepID=UPI003D7BD5A9